jgi:predicted nucleic acid-binding protein
MILIDTSALIDALTGPRKSAPSLRRFIESGERILLTTIVLYEWARGPRKREELLAQEALFPNENAIPFGAEEAIIAAELYRNVRAARGREIDLAIAACAVNHGAILWTVNTRDFADIPGLEVVSGP